jgi:hypothetical protein
MIGLPSMLSKLFKFKPIAFVPMLHFLDTRPIAAVKGAAVRQGAQITWMPIAKSYSHASHTLFGFCAMFWISFALSRGLPL